MTSRGWVVVLATLVAALVGVANPARAVPRDDAAAFEALSAGDVYVATEDLGKDVAPTIAARLQEKVDELRGRGSPVKMAIVTDLRGDGVFGYAQRLRARLGYDGTLLVTTLTGPAGAAGPRTPRSLRSAFAAARVNDMGSASERLRTAADLAVPPPPRPPSGWRGLVSFIVLAVLGAAAAVGWGLRREQRRARRVADHERGALVLGLDALDARLRALDAPAAAGPPEAAEALAQAHHHHSAGRAAAQMAGSLFDAPAGFAALDAGLREAARAGELVGEPFPPDRPLDGLCSADPAHGLASDVATLADRPGRVPVCRRCAAEVHAGRAIRRRVLPTLDGPVPFDQVELSQVPDASGTPGPEPAATGPS